MRPFNYHWIFILFFIPVVSFASPPEPPADIKLGDVHRVNSYLKELVTYWLDEDDIAGLSVAIVSDNTVTLQDGFGFSDLDSEQQARSDTIYRVGAISGVFTAGLILRLTEMGLLKLDDDINKYLPQLNFQYYDNKKYTITIKNLLTHHAGLPMSRFEGSWSEQESNLEALLVQLDHTYASYPPNTVYAYSNIAYSLLALIVERVTKGSFVDAIRQHVLTPLDMNDTDIRYSKKIQSQLATGYKKGEIHKLLFPRDIALLGIYSNVKDMSKFMRMMLGYGDKSILSKINLQSMMNAHNSNVTLDLNKKIGLGVNIGGMKVINGGPVVWRSGATLAFRARMALLPKHDIAVIVLSNDSKSWSALEDISERALQLMLQAKVGINQDSKQKQGKGEIADLPVQKFSDYYSSFIGYIPIQKDGDKITASLLDWPLNVNPAGDGWYTLEYDLFGFIPIDVSWIADLKIKPTVVENKKILIALYKGTKYLVGSHFSFTRPSPVWVQRQGDYRIINHDALLENVEISSGELRVSGDKIFFIYELPNWYGLELQLPLQILTDDAVIIPGLGTALNEIVQVKRFGNKEYLEYSGYLLEKEEQKESIFDF